MAKKTFIVAHPKHYMKVKGKMIHVEKGTEITLEEKDAKSLVKQEKILVSGSKKKLAVGDKVEASKPDAE